MNVWATLAAVLLSWNLTVQSFYDLPQIKVQSNADQTNLTLSDQRLEEKKVIPHKIDNNSWGVKITAQSSAVMDKNTGLVLWQKNADQVRSLASITKLMTVMVFLDHNPGWDKVITMEQPDETSELQPNILRGESVTVRDLFNVTLVASDNNAARALARSTGLSQEEFVKEMNTKAQSLKMSQSHFVELTGLEAANQATALDALKMGQAAFSKSEIQKAVIQKTYTLVTQDGRTKKVLSTNNLLKSYLDVRAGKTGYIEAAGYCLLVEVANETGQEILTVVLGSTAHEDRFQDAKILSGWVFENYQWF
jgi:D-alanyl-D-alanine endopeptidase (penicillin-binding protein 7)